MVNFCTFLLTENVELHVTLDDILKMKFRLGLWREHYSVEDKGLSFVREAEDYQMLVTPEQVQSYEHSEHAMLAKELSQQLSLTKRSVTQMEYCCVHDHMYSHMCSIIHFGTGHRSGVSANY